MTAVVERRRFLRAAALAGLGAPLLATARPLGEASASTGGTGFTHGVASGDPTAERVVLWTRVELGSTREQEVRWRVARDPRLAAVIAEGTAFASPAQDGIVQVEVTGLLPGTPYWYGFETEGRHSSIGRTRTLPAPGVERVRVAVLSCGNLEAGWFNAYARVAERDDLDLVIHLGDYIYEYGDLPDTAPPIPGRRHDPRVELLSLTDYRRRYAQYRLDPDLQHLHSRHPVVPLFDDHEVADDTWATGARAHGPEDGDFAQRRTAALTAWSEWHPRAAAEPEPWRGLPLGDLLDASVVDGRSHRPRMGDPAIDGEADDCLGPTQRAWLDGRLATRAGRWPVVMTQQPVTRRLDADGTPLGVAGWNGFPAAQRAMLDAVGRSGALLVAGDVHSSWLVETGDVVEAVGPSVTSGSHADRHGADAARDDERALRRANRDVRWLDLSSHGYVLLDADAERCRVEWWFVDGVDDRRSGQRLARVHELR